MRANSLRRAAAVATLAVVAVVAGAAIGPARAHDAGEDTVTPVQNQGLPDLPGKKLVMAVVSYEPGGASQAHRHAGSVFAYVLEGEIVSQLEGHPPVTYKVGESWYEPPLTPHLVSRNASSTKPVKLLAVLVLDEHGAIKEPLPK